MAVAMKILKTEPGANWRLDRAVQQRSARIVVESCPFVGRNANGEIVGVKRGPAGHRQDFAGARVHGHDGAFFTGHVVVRDCLQIVVDGQLDGFARDGVFLFEAADFLANAIDDHTAQAVRAHQGFVVLILQAGFADDVAGFQAGSESSTCSALTSPT